MSQSRSQTILFADVSGSTRLFETKGDVVSRLPKPFREAAGTAKNVDCNGALASVLPNHVNLSPRVRPTT